MVSANQVNAIVPYAVANRAATEVRVEVAGRLLPPSTFAVRQYSPALFTLNGSGVGPAAVLNQDGTVNSPSNPADRNSFVSLFVNGLALLRQSRVDGEIATTASGALPGAIAVTIFNRPLQISYVGTSPGLVAALTQINVLIPRDSAFGPAVPLRVSGSNTNSQERATIAIR